MGRRLKALKEAFLPKRDPIQTTTKIAKHIYKQDYTTLPYKRFSYQLSLLMVESLLFSVCTHMGSEIMAFGTETETGPEDTVTADGQTCKQYLDRWARDNDLDSILYQSALELLLTGNSFWKVSEDGKLSHIQLSLVKGATKVNETPPKYEEYNLEMMSSSSVKEYKWGEFVHLRINVIGDDYAPFGHGIVEALIRSVSSEVPSLFEMRNKLKVALINLSLRAGIPFRFVSLLTGTDAEIDQVKTELDSMPCWGGNIVSGKQFEIRSDMLPRSAILDAFQENLTQELMWLLGDPLLKLISTPGFTEASSRVALEMHMKKVALYQRILRRAVERVYRLALKGSSWDPDIIDPKLKFKEPPIEVEENE